MKIFLTLLLTFCFYSAMYYRSATRQLRLFLKSENMDDIMKRVTTLPLLIGNTDTESYLAQPFVLVLRVVAIIIEILCCWWAYSLAHWWGTLFVILIGGGLAISRKIQIDYIDIFINRARILLIFSILIIAGILLGGS